MKIKLIFSKSKPGRYITHNAAAPLAAQVSILNPKATRAADRPIIYFLHGHIHRIILRIRSGD